MRATFILAFLFAACGDDPAPANNPDLSVMVSPDMTASGTTCAAALQCAQGCTGANAQSCSAACFMGVSPAAMPYSTALVQCITGKCTSLGGDAGTSDCDDPGSMDCGTCVQARCLTEATACFTH